jgi:hypothetical protein
MVGFFFTQKGACSAVPEVNSDIRRARILEPLERLIRSGATQGERDAAKGRWEHITGEKWVGKSKASQQNTRHSGSSSNKSSGPTFDDDFWETIFGKGFNKGGGGFSGFEDFAKDFGGYYSNAGSRPNDSYDSYTYGQKAYEDARYRDPFKNREEQQRSRGRSKRDYDFTFNPCTDNQYRYLDSICRFFRWKHPTKDDISFEEASSFLDKHDRIFKMFRQDMKDFSRLKDLFEAFGVKWDQTKRTWKWDFEKKGGVL